MLSKYKGSSGTGIMRSTGDLISARSSWQNTENRNLEYLLHFRYTWMNKFISKASKGLEIGSGIGASKKYIRKDSDLLISDNNDNDWLDINNLDAGEIKKYSDRNFEYIVANNVIHHLAYPAQFIADCFEILPRNGKLIIQEINTSILCRFILRILRHEPFDETANVMDFKIPQSDPHDNWDANCSIPKILFADRNCFENDFNHLRISHLKYTEVFNLLLSGGVTAKTWYPRLPTIILDLLRSVDSVLCAISPRIFAFQMQVVIERDE